MAPTSALFRISGLIDKSVPKEFIKKDFFASDSHLDFLNILMRSRGGDLGEAARLVNLINKMKQRETKIITISYDYVSSSALTIFATGEIRVANSENDTFFFHRAEALNSTVPNQKVLDGEKSAFLFLSEQFKLPIETIYDFANKQKKITATDALTLGIVHRIN